MVQMMERMLAEMKAGHEKKTARLEATTGSHHELVAIMKASQEKVEAKTDACVGKLVVPTEEAVVETIEALDGRHLAIRHRRQPKKWTQGDGGSWNKLAAAR
jgi:hypothetical protein